MRAGEEREQNDATDALQPVSQDQREAGRHQQHPAAQYTVRYGFCAILLEGGLV